MIKDTMRQHNGQQWWASTCFSRMFLEDWICWSRLNRKWDSCKLPGRWAQISRCLAGAMYLGMGTWNRAITIVMLQKILQTLPQPSSYIEYWWMSIEFFIDSYRIFSERKANDSAPCFGQICQDIHDLPSALVDCNFCHLAALRFCHIRSPLDMQRKNPAHLSSIWRIHAANQGKNEWHTYWRIGWPHMLNLPVVQKGREMAWAVSNHRIRGIDILQERHDTQVGWRTLGNSTFDRGKCDAKKWTELSSIEFNFDRGKIVKRHFDKNKLINRNLIEVSLLVVNLMETSWHRGNFDGDNVGWIKVA